MNAERWERIGALFAEARSVPPDRRDALLDRSCGEDAGLRAEVERLLADDETSDRDGFLGSACPARLSQLLGVGDEPVVGGSGAFSGRRIGDYRLHGLIGRGGTSDVYEASGPAPGRLAFKLVQGHMATQDVLRRFRAEQDLLAAIDHPNVARFLDRGLTEDGLSYLVMEFVEGRRIDRYCDERGLGLADRARLLLQVCRAVAFIHSRGVLHRDLTPPNILVTPEGVAKLVDFGIAKAMAPDPETPASTDRTATGAILGTPEYLSPEQAMGRSSEADPRTDVYTLGVLLYRLLTGRTPFQGLTLVALLDEIRLSDPVPPTRLNAGISRPLEVICLTCLQKDARRRYATASDLADDLTRWLDGRPIKARPVPIRVKAVQWCRRRPAVAGLIAALAATVLVGFAVLFGLYRRAEGHRQQAERNLEVASSMIRHLEAFLFDISDGSGGLRVPRKDEQHYGDMSRGFGIGSWNRIAGLLLEQLPKVRSMREFPPELLLWSSQLEGTVAGRLRSNDRWDEAWILERERLDMLRECWELHPGDEAFAWETARALMAASQHEQRAFRTDAALDDLDRGAALVLLTPGRASDRLVVAARLSAAYLELEERSARGGRPALARRAGDGPVKLRALVTPELDGGPELILLKACIVADCGEWDGARDVVESLASGSSAVSSKSRDPRAIDLGLGEWFRRETWRWDQMLLDGSSGIERRDRATDDIVRLLARLGRALGISDGLSLGATASITEEIYTRAAERRREGRLDQADRTIDGFMGLARWIVREFPDNPHSHELIAQAYGQRAKNAWKREDVEAVRRELTRSVEEWERAVSLSRGEDGRLLENLQNSKNRLAALPKS